MMDRLIVAIDTLDPARATSLVSAVAPYAGVIKLGFEFILANGPAGIGKLNSGPIFLDVKLHDIPNTVAGAIRAVLPLRPRMVTVHAAGGPAMIRAARDTADSAGPDRPLILAVTVLTSINQSTSALIGGNGTIDEQVLRLAELAVQSGADGLVCSPLEVAMLRRTLSADVKLVVPGIRPEGADPGDQLRTMTPRQAIDAGADWIVVGRPITNSSDPGQAAAAIVASLQ